MTTNNIVKYIKSFYKNRSLLYDLEYNCLKLIESNYNCICGLNKYHFPKIIDSCPEKCKFVLSNCGKSIDKYKKYNQKINIINPDKQINCIIHNLKKCKIKHLDMPNNGKNLCVDKNGTLSLIDFDWAAINDKYVSNIFRRKEKRYSKNKDYYTSFFYLIKNAIN